jgi:hypothetical protein
MKRRFHIYSLTLIVSVIFAGATASRADVVTDWNKITLDANNIAPPRPGPSNLLDVAAVQLAVYDAIQAYEHDYRPYCVDIQGAAGSPEAAAARAAYDVLKARFTLPAQATQAAFVDTAYANYLMDHGISPMDAGTGVGGAAANCINETRSNDNSFPGVYPPFFGGTELGQWRPIAAGTSMAAPWLGHVTPFTMKSLSQFRPGPPPALDSPEYTRDYNEVKSTGSVNSTTRTPDQTGIGNFWNLNYQAVINTMLRDLSTENIDNISDSSRFFALTSTATADAVIAAWDSKSAYNFWRPVTAIQNGEQDGNPKTEGDAGWVALIGNPPYPDYTSGANAVMAASTRAAHLFFGENEMNVVVTKTPNGPTRTFEKLSAVRDEVVEARIYGGIHFRFADTAGRKQGEHIAQWAHGHYFQPVD